MDRALLVLISLADSPKHGYAMTRDIETFAHVKLSPGTLYGAVTRLLDDGFITPLAPEHRRQPYRITAAGTHALLAELSSMAALTVIGLSRLQHV